MPVYCCVIKKKRKKRKLKIKNTDFGLEKKKGGKTDTQTKSIFSTSSVSCISVKEI